MAFGRGPSIPITSSFNDKGIKDAERSMNRLGSTGNKVFAGMSKKALGFAGAASAIGAAGVGLAAVIGTGMGELIEAEAAMAQVENRLKATGNAANVTAKQVAALSATLEKKTGIDGDQVTAAQAMLLSFTNVRNEVGKTNGVYSQATKLALDFAIRQAEVTGGAVNLKTAYTAVGKALQDPIKGIGALSRGGVTFSAQQKEQIKTLVESGQVMKAQGLVVDQLRKKVGGAGEAFGGTTRGNIEKTKRQFEALSAELTAQLLPAINKVLIYLNTKFIPYMRTTVVPFIRKDVVPVVRAFAEGMGEATRNIVATGRATKATITWLDRLHAKFLLFPGLSAVSKVPGANRAVGALFGPILGPGVSRLLNARGGVIPGPRGAGDVVPSMLTPGEVVLNERQQSIVGPGRIMSALASTGGRIGGSRFASGGIVDVALARARRELGDPYGKPSEGMSRTGPGSWDCSGYATYVAGVNVGGSTMSAYSASSRAKGNEPILWGFSKSHSGGYRGGYDEHMGVRVGGTWFQTSNKQVRQTGTDSQWSELRVPNGLGGLTGSATVGDGDPNFTAPSPAQLAKQKKSLLSQARRLLSGPAGTGMSATDVASNSITARHRDDSLQDKRVRASAMTAARAMGITNPENIEARAEAEVLRTRLKEINADARDVTRASKKVKAAIAKAKVRRGKLYKQMQKTPARNQSRLQALKEAVANANSEISSMYDELWGLILQAKDLQAEAAELGYDIGQLAQEIANLPATAAAEDSGSATEAGVSADAQAQISQAQEATRVAQRASALSAGFLRTVGSTGDLTGGSGGVLTVNFMSLYPGDPAVQAEMASWLTGVLGGQGSVPATQFQV